MENYPILKSPRAWRFIFSLPFLSLLLGLLLGQYVQAQDCGSPAVEYSTYLGGSDAEFLSQIVLGADGSTYLVGRTNSSDFPVTTGAAQATYSTVFNYTLTKLDPSGQVVYSTYWGDGFQQEPKIVLGVDGSVYLAGTNNSNTLSTTPGAAQTSIGGGGGGQDYTLTKFDPSGQVVYATYWGGSGNENENQIALGADGCVYLAGRTGSNNFPVTAGAAQTTFGGDSDYTLTKFDPSGQVVYSTYWGGDGAEGEPQIVLGADGSVYLAGQTGDNTFPVTAGAAQTTSMSANPDYTLTKFDPSGQVVYSTYWGGDGIEEEPQIVLGADGCVYLAGSTDDINFPVTAGAAQPTFGDSQDYTLTKFDPSGQVVYATYWGGDGDESSVEIVLGADGCVYLTGQTSSLDFPVTAGAAQTSPGGGQDYTLTKFDPSGQVVYSSYWGGGGTEGTPQIVLGADACVYLSGRTSAIDFPVTPDAIQSTFGGGDFENTLTKFDASGQVVYSTYWGGNSNEQPPQIALDADGDVYLAGWTSSTNFPVTAGAAQTSPGGSIDYTLTKFSGMPMFCEENTISPETQSFCIGGPIQPLMGNVVPPSWQMLPIYLWQISTTSNTGPWTDIPGGVLPNYSPGIASGDRWYRRLVIHPQTMETISISNVAVVTGSTFTAPVINASEDLYTCPGTAVTIGGSPTVSGGTQPYNISWDFGMFLNDNTAQNPVATVTESTIFTVEVTDANGCYNLDQMTVNVYPADVGLDASICSPGEQVRIGSLPIPDEPATYSWAPATTLSCADCPRPIASPTMNTTYTLTKTITLPGGGTCQTMDQIDVNLLSPPVSTLEDVVWCYDENNPNRFQIGYSPEANKSYTWAPGSFLESNNSSSVFFNSGNIFLTPTGREGNPVNQNPFEYLLTIEEEGCTWIDTMQVYMIRADADENGCGPRTIGVDWHPQIPATYQWTNISGPNLITGPTNQVVTTVGGHLTETSVYELEVCFMGLCCTDRVVVPPCECNVVISGNFPADCAASSDLTLTAAGTFSGFPGNLDASLIEYTWSPCGALNTCSGTEVMVNDGFAGTISVTVSHPDLPGFGCSDVISVFDPAVSIPEFNPSDATTCISGASVAIGEAPVAGYSYIWSGPSGFSSTSSNPMVNPAETSEYFVTVTDNGTGCTVEDMATVRVLDDLVDAGPDQIVCPGAVVQIGTPDPSGGTWQYSWMPVNSPWQNGTNETSAQPEVLVASSLTFNLTVTDPVSGCSATDEVVVTVDDNPPVPPNFNNVTICAGEQIRIGGDPLSNALYAWSPATGLSCTDCPNPIASPTVTTDYTVLITLPGTCANQPSTTITVTVNDPPALSLIDREKCPSGGSLELNPTSVGACVGCTYSWNPTNDLTGVNTINPTTSTTIPRSYTLTVTQPDGCQPRSVVIVTIAASNAGSNRTICLGSSTVLGSTTNDAASTYSWSPTAGLDNPTLRQPTFTPMAAGTYTFTVTETRQVNGANCVLEATVSVIVQDVMAPEMETSYNLCEATCQVLGPEPQAGFSYFWAPIDGLSCFDCPNPEVCPTEDRVYTLTMISNNTGCSVEVPVSVAIFPISIPAITLRNLTNCVGSRIPLDAEVAPVGDYSFEWTPLTGLNDATIQQPTLNTTRLTPGMYEYVLTVSDNETGCTGITARTTITVNDNVLPAITLATTPATCNAVTNIPQNDGIITLTAATNATHYGVSSLNPVNGDYDGPMSIAAGATAFTAAASLSIELVNNAPNTGGTYVVRIFNGIDGCFMDETVTVAANNSCTLACTTPTLTALTNQTICQGGSFTAANVTTSVTNAVAVTYQWFNNNGTNNPNTDPIASQTTATLGVLPSAPGVYAYRVRATNSSDNTCFAEETVILTINALPTLVIGTPTCDVSGTVYSVTVTTTNATALSSMSGIISGTAPNFTVSGINAGTNVTLTATNTATSPNCSAMLAVSSPSCTLPCTDPILTALTNQTICQGGSFTAANVTTSVTNAVAVTYQWFNNNGTNNPNTDPIASQTTATLGVLPSAPGVYAYRVRATNSSDNTCFAEETVILTINALPTLVGGSLCVEEMITLMGSGTPNTTTPYTSSTPTIATITDNGVVTGLAAGNTTITYTDNNGCEATAMVLVNPLPTINTSSNSPVCEGEDIQLMATFNPTGTSTTALSWSWTGPNGFTSTIQNPTISGATTANIGNYTVTVTDNNNCVASAMVAVMVDERVVAEAGLPQIICSTTIVDLASIGANISPITLGGTWSSSGTGIFDDGAGEFSVATTYTPSAADITAGSVVLTLTTNDPANLAPTNICPATSDTVTITILKVDCGTFPWSGN